MSEQMTLELNNGAVMPMAGIGTFLLSPDCRGKHRPGGPCRIP